MKQIIMGLLILLFSSSLYASDMIVQKELSHWTIIRGDVKVDYAQTSCGYLSKNVLLNLYHDSGAGSFDWSDMKYKSFRDKKLNQECKRLTNEMNRRIGK